MAPGITSALGVFIAAVCRRSRQLRFPQPASATTPAFIGPFDWEPFRELLALDDVNIFRLNDNDNDRQPVTGWTNQEIVAIGALFTSAVSKSNSADVKALFGSKESVNIDGVRIFERYVVQTAKVLPRLNKICDRAFSENNCGIDAMMLSFTEKTFPKRWTDCGFGSAFPHIAHEIFGPDAFVNPDLDYIQTLKPEVNTCLNAMMVNNHVRLKNRFTNERKRRDNACEVLEKSWLDATSQEKITQSSIASILRTAAKHIRILRVPSASKADEKIVDAWDERITGIRQLLGLEASGKGIIRFPDALKEALEDLATLSNREDFKDKRFMWELLADLETASGRDEIDEDQTQFSHAEAFAAAHDAHAWPTGTERYENLSESVLATQYIGVGSFNDVPGINKIMPKDPLVARDPWKEPIFFQDEKNVRPFRLDPLQWQAIAAYASNAFDGLPTSNNDECGTGKTYMSIGFVNMVHRFRAHHDETGGFPALEYSKRSWPEFPTSSDDLSWMPQVVSPLKPGGIPHLPALVVAPLQLVAQWISEIHNCLEPHGVVVLPYISMSIEAKNQFWSSTVPQAVKTVGGSLGNLIIVASTDVVRRDYGMTFVQKARGKEGWSLCGTGPKASAMAENSIYGRRYTVVFFDEIHHARKTTSAAHKSLAILARMNPVAIGLTATPVITEPDDLIGIGKLLNVPAFRREVNQQRFREFKRLLNRARKEDKANGSSLRETILQRGASDEWIDDESPTAIHISMSQAQEIRTLYGNCVIRRTPRRPEGPISAEDELKYPPPSFESIILAPPSNEEQAALDSLYQREADEERVLSKRETTFYNAIRHTLVHRQGQQIDPSHPKSMKDWENDPSTKGNLVRFILRKYMDRNKSISDGVGRNLTNHPPRPLYKLADGKLVEDLEIEQPVARSTTSPMDCIVIYSHWLKMSGMLLKVLTLDGYDVVEYNGKMKARERERVLQDFKQNRHRRILIITDIGTTGLNLQFATVLIIVDMLWSAQEDRQLIGRLVRRGQMACAHIYRLVLQGTTDVLLNNISYSKKQVSDAFKYAPLVLQRICQLERGEVNDIQVEQHVLGAQGSKLARGTAAVHSHVVSKQTLHQDDAPLPDVLNEAEDTFTDAPIDCISSNAQDEMDLPSIWSQSASEPVSSNVTSDEETPSTDSRHKGVVEHTSPRINTIPNYAQTSTHTTKEDADFFSTCTIVFSVDGAVEDTDSEGSLDPETCAASCTTYSPSSKSLHAVQAQFKQISTPKTAVEPVIQVDTLMDEDEFDDLPPNPSLSQRTLPPVALAGEGKLSKRALARVKSSQNRVKHSMNVSEDGDEVPAAKRRRKHPSAAQKRRSTEDQTRNVVQAINSTVGTGGAVSGRGKVVTAPGLSNKELPRKF